MPESRFRDPQWREFRHASGEVLPFRFVRSARRTIALYVNRDGSILVRAPLRVALSEIHFFMSERWDWLQTQRTRLLESPAPAPFKYRDGEVFQHFGHDCLLRVERGGRNQARMQGDVLRVMLTPESFSSEEALVQIIASWQRREAARVFPLRLAACHERMSAMALPFPTLKIRKMRSRWGSCSRNASITLNLDLVRMPLDCLDYVIVHELCHLLEFNHSPRFYELQSHFLPDWKERRQNLEQLAREFHGF